MVIYPYNPMLSAYIPAFPLLVGPLYQPFLNQPSLRANFLNP
jgi:hypothetical protein